MPCGRLANWQTNLLYENQEAAGPHRGAMNFVRGPQIVNDQGEQENVGQQGGDKNPTVAEGDGQASDGGNQKRVGGYVNETFVGSRIPAVSKSKKQDDGGDRHVRQRNNVKRLRIAARWPGSPDQ